LNPNLQTEKDAVYYVLVLSCIIIVHFFFGIILSFYNPYFFFSTILDIFTFTYGHILCPSTQAWAQCQNVVPLEPQPVSRHGEYMRKK